MESSGDQDIFSHDGTVIQDEMIISYSDIFLIIMTTHFLIITTGRFALFNN